MSSQIPEAVLLQSPPSQADGVAARSNVGPSDAVQMWPVDDPLVAAWSANAHPRWGRWSVFARPSGWIRHLDGQTEIIPNERAASSFEMHTLPEILNHDPVCDLRRIMEYPAGPENSREPSSPSLPFAGGWIGRLSYDFGRCLEPTVSRGRRNLHQGSPHDDSLSRRGPLFEFAWCEDALVFDHTHQRWHVIGQPPVDPAALTSRSHDARTTTDFHLAPLQPLQPRACVESAVARTIEYIRAGDIFQANIAQQFIGDFEGDTRALFRTAMQQTPARYGAYLESPDERTSLSFSPELFFELHGVNRTLTTRPIKGTAPSNADPEILAASAKDAAELAMIVDLMRNDLGRVCDFNTVQVTDARCIETHPAVHHGVATVQGRLGANRSIADVMCATFPAGSITGAPKIRAMQIIEELEPYERGPFFGSVGWISRHGDACFNVAIRTMEIDRVMHRARYAAGAGIVADSQPDLEYEEMLLKARAVESLCNSRSRA